ncbi:MAG: hypothetical protein II746_07410, partial [Bacteroidaceae bacterium]|nr:hypothetical protein [Bacteroidaceae bacterium]
VVQFGIHSCILYKGLGAHCFHAKLLLFSQTAIEKAKNLPKTLLSARDIGEGGQRRHADATA